MRLIWLMLIAFPVAAETLHASWAVGPRNQGVSTIGSRGYNIPSSIIEDPTHDQ